MTSYFADRFLLGGGIDEQKIHQSVVTGASGAGINYFELRLTGGVGRRHITWTSLDAR